MGNKNIKTKLHNLYEKIAPYMSIIDKDHPKEHLEVINRRFNRVVGMTTLMVLMLQSIVDFFAYDSMGSILFLIYGCEIWFTFLYLCVFQSNVSYVIKKEVNGYIGAFSEIQAVANLALLEMIVPFILLLNENNTDYSNFRGNFSVLEHKMWFTVACVGVYLYVNLTSYYYERKTEDTIKNGEGFSQNSMIIIWPLFVLIPFLSINFMYAIELRYLSIYKAGEGAFICILGAIALSYLMFTKKKSRVLLVVIFFELLIFLFCFGLDLYLWNTHIPYYLEPGSYRYDYYGDETTIEAKLYIQDDDNKSNNSSIVFSLTEYDDEGNILTTGKVSYIIEAYEWKKTLFRYWDDDGGEWVKRKDLKTATPICIILSDTNLDSEDHFTKWLRGDEYVYSDDKDRLCDSIVLLEDGSLWFRRIHFFPE